MTTPFIHLQLHTEYSLVDGIVRIKPLIEKIKALNMPAVAVTDLTNCFAMVKFYRAAVSAGIKPLVGSEFKLIEPQQKQSTRIVLLCQNAKGYNNLSQLLSRAYIEGQQQQAPSIQLAWLKQHSDGLIALALGHQSDIGQALLNDHADRAHDLLNNWQALFPQRFYLTLQRTNRPDEERYIQQVLPFAEQYQIPLVAINDVCFIDKNDYEAHEARVCIHAGQVLTDTQRQSAYSEEQYLRSTQEMQALFADIPQALDNSIEIARRCNFSLTLDQLFLPQFPIPAGQTTESYFAQLAQHGLVERLQKLYGDNVAHLREQQPIYEQRLQMELDVINKMGFAGYFLIVADFIKWSKDHDIPVGPGRGSGAGSLVAYSFGITDIDPLAYDLLFERFLNPERVSMPDFDIDFCMEGRDRVIDYVAEHYGKQSVSQIITFGTMAAKAVIRDVGRVLGHPYGFVDQIAKLIPFELGITLDKALEQEELLQQRYKEEEEVKGLIDLARKLEGITRNAGKHAGGVVISPTALTDFTPLYCEPGGKHIISQLDKDDVEAIGLVKFDFLGLRTLTIIHWAVQIANKQHEAAGQELLDITSIPLDDKKTFSLLKAYQTTAVFQLESRGMKDLIKRLQPDKFEEIIALVALFRPGPLQSGMVDDFINRKHGRSPVSYLHPALEAILKPTYGVILYQEQVMKIAQVLAGYTLGSADILRKAMGKKQPDEMAKQRAIFIEGATKNKVEPHIADEIFNLMEKFAGYGFNKSHSAAYALISYQTAWLKTHYPAAFMAAVLSADMDNTDKVVMLIDECRQLGLTILSPDINRSHYQFTVGDKPHTLIYGMGAIKGVGQAAIDSVIDTREQQGNFKDLFDFCQRIDSHKCNRRTLEALIKAGVMDKLGAHRASLLASLPSALKQAEQQAQDVAQGQRSLFGDDVAVETAKIDYAPVPEWSEQQRLQGEKETLGLYLTGHPINQYRTELQHFVTAPINQIKAQGQQSMVVAGLISSIRTMQTKRGDKMAFVALDDGTGRIEITVFSELFHQHRELLQKDNLIVVKAEISIDRFSGNQRTTVEDIMTIEQARQRFARYLLLRLNQQQCDKGVVDELTDLLKNYRDGACPVMLEYQRPGAKATMPLGGEWQITPSDGLLDELRHLLDEHAVEMYYG